MEVDDLQSTLGQDLGEWRSLDGVEAVSGNIVDGLLSLLHTGDVVPEGSVLVLRLGRLEPEVLGELLPVGSILVDS